MRQGRGLLRLLTLFFEPDGEDEGGEVSMDQRAQMMMKVRRVHSSLGHPPKGALL